MDFRHSFGIPGKDLTDDLITPNFRALPCFRAIELSTRVGGYLQVLQLHSKPEHYLIDYAVVLGVPPRQRTGAPYTLSRRQLTDLAILEYQTFPNQLRDLSDAIEHRLGKQPVSPSRFDPFAPNGPWRYMPPASYADLCSRATSTVARPATHQAIDDWNVAVTLWNAVKQDRPQRILMRIDHDNPKEHS